MKSTILGLITIKIFIVIGFTLCLSSCLKTKDSKIYRIGFSQCVAKDNWRQTMLNEMKSELSFHNNIEFFYRDANGNSTTQISQIEELARQNIDLLIVSPNEIKPITPIIEKVYESGIPVVVVDRRTSSKEYTAFIGADNFEVGQNAGRYAALLLKRKGNVMEVTGLPDASPVIDRHNGFMDIISKYPEIKYVKKVYGNWGAQSLYKAVEENLKSFPDLNLVFAQNDRIAFDVYKICRKLNLEKKIKIIGVDGLPLKGEGLDMVDNKYIAASVLYPTGGQESIETALNILENKPFVKENQLFTTIIDSANVKIMKMQGAKILSQQHDIEERQKKIDQEKLISENQSVLIVFISIILALALIFGGISYYYLKENKKINNRLKLQNEEILIQKNKIIEISRESELAHQSKLDFFTKISHEFRTPLTLIVSPAEDLLTNQSLAVHIKNQVNLIYKNAFRLLRLVNQLLDFRKIEFNKMAVQATETDLVRLINDILNSFLFIAKKRNIDCRMLTRDASLKVWVDESMMEKVFYNLLSNAFKFTDNYGSITVSIEKSELSKQVIVKVKDSGIGMTAEEVKNAFNVFYQGNFDNHKGSGLGLALTKELVLLHEGTIEVESEKNKGTVFTVRLKLSKEHFSEEQIAAPNNTKEVIQNDQMFLAPDLIPDAKTESGDVTGIANNREEIILIIDDNPELRQFLKSALEYKYHIIEADNGVNGIKEIFENMPDLIISDIMMPGIDGVKLSQQIKNDIRTSHIPLILLTALVGKEDELKGLKSMADAYVTKPFNLEILKQTIANLLENRVKLKDHFSSQIPTYIKTSLSKKADRKFIADFIAFVENNIANDQLSIEDICTQMGVPKIQLYRKVKSLLGTNINEYILNTRIQKAKYYLQNEELSVSEIAYKTGFSTPAYFSTVFKNKTGVTPSNFKSNYDQL